VPPPAAASNQQPAASPPVFVVLLQGHTWVQMMLSTKSVHALPTLVVVLWCAKLQTTSNANSAHTLPALMVLPTWCATLQAT
jgi:hypothetical protein